MQNQKSFIPFRRFDSWQNAQHCVEMLEKTGIEYKLEEYDKNPVVLGSLLTEKEFLIKVRRDDFEQADEKLLQAIEITASDLEPSKMGKFKIIVGALGLVFILYVCISTAYLLYEDYRRWGFKTGIERWLEKHRLMNERIERDQEKSGKTQDQYL